MWYKLKHNLSINFWVTVRDVTEHLVCVRWLVPTTTLRTDAVSSLYPQSTGNQRSEDICLQSCGQFRWLQMPCCCYLHRIFQLLQLQTEEQRPIQTYPNKWESQNKYADSIKNTRSHVRLKMTNHCHILNPFELIINYCPRDWPACGLPEFPNL